MLFFFITPKRIKLRNGIVSNKYYHITFCALRKKPMGVEETKRLINCRKYTAVLLFYSKKVRKKCDLPGQYLLLIHKTKNPTIFNMLRWVTGSLGQTTHRQSVWCSIYYFIFLNFLQNYLQKSFQFIAFYSFYNFTKIKNKEFPVA